MRHSQRTSGSCREAGFTSLEFTNSLSAAALLVTATVTGTFDFFADMQRVSVVNDMLNGLRVARATAHKHSTTVTVCPSKDRYTCSATGDWSDGWIAFVDKNGNGEMDGRDSRRVFARALNGSERIKVISDWDRFSFAPGRTVQVAAGDAAATLCVLDDRGSEQSRVIWINSRGHAELHRTRPQREIEENAARDFSHRRTDCY